LSTAIPISGAVTEPCLQVEVMDPRLINETLLRQDGVVSRRQVLAAGCSDSFIERKIRRREWARL
jgi:hypothetical protein